MEELSKFKVMFNDKNEVSKSMNMDKGEVSKEEEKLNKFCGPFLLEHFDSSEYSLAVPGEGTRPEVRIVWVVGEGFKQRPICLTSWRLGNLYHGEVTILLRNFIGLLRF